MLIVLSTSLRDWFVDGEGEHAVVLRVHVGSLTDEAWECIENIYRDLPNDGVVHAFIGETSLKDMLPPSLDIIGNFVTKDTGVLGNLVFVGETVDNIVGLGTNHVDAFFLANLCVVSFEHRYRGFQSRGQLVFKIVLL